ncbi:Rpp20 domain containing protein [Pyrenophora tritici-repentis]|nr:uncharacterized protein PTRG_07193 [Pyrenophora tritici-repentis Pt-1C-BFP]KAA8614760.1 Rpp20 multi-domain protein [Pyrenophora tritici-repentis]EDU50112.1 conserved hypothetical protein [Pyrenophora tritici-repentis Pt-1C-BFP]KAF7444584.1 Rpp20 multi-domain protein [Pyrenophora tritici-repentis]KAF7564757.1 Rpp20 multi-domain protein [Pyrenophora tritici-repentis]KAG9378832.1 Rpp20 multi-domain protein [Pyrenophora tritici-repentis]
MTDATPPCGQRPPPSSKTTCTPKTAVESTLSAPNLTPNPPKEGQILPPTSKPAPKSRKPVNRKKLAKPPQNASISTRPLLHPALPTPHSSSASPKTIYITATTPYIPCVKRVRKLLADITKREKQSAASLDSRAGGAARGGQHGAKVLEANGRLEAKDVERNVAEEASKKGEARKVGGMVYLKATGRAIPRALEIGLHFQEDESCRVRVELGNVKAVDDIEVKSGATEQEQQAEGEADDDIPETRIRTLSSVTVSIGLV